MKVLDVIYSVDPQTGGPIEGILSSSEIWTRHGHTRHIASLDSPDVPVVKECPMTVFALGPSGRWYQTAKKIIPWLRYGYTPSLVRWLNQNAQKYDAVIIHGLWNYTSYGSWRALRRLAVPYFLFAHGMLDPWFKKAYPRKHIAKHIFWKLFEAKVVRDARAVFFISEEEMQLAPASYSPFKCRGIILRFGALDRSGDPQRELKSFSRKTPKLKDRAFILFLARIVPKKGPDLLLHAFARYAARFPDYDLVLAGPDEIGWQAQLIQLTAELGIKCRVHWPGMLTSEEKSGAFRAAQFFALPSHQENFGLTVVEALVAGTPVLITNKVNIWREVEELAAGCVVADTIDGIANGLQRMCSLTQDEKKLMRQNARAAFTKRFDLAHNAKLQWEAIEKMTGTDENNFNVFNDTVELNKINKP